MMFCNDAGDTIQSGRGNDTITAGGGKDLLSGGPGNDTFVFKSLASSFDVVTDFAVSSDVVDMRPLMASIGYKGVNAVADQWLSLSSDGHGGTNLMVNPH